MKTFGLFLSVFALSISSIAQVNLSSSLTACYALNGNGIEAINNQTGTLVTVSSAPDRFSNANSALQFPGNAGAVVKLPNSPFTKPATTISFSGWYKLSNLAYQNLVFAKNIWTSYFTAYSLITEFVNGAYRFRAYRQNGSGNNLVTSTTAIQVNTWYHVVFSISSSTMQIFVNGVLENSAATTITAFNYDNTRGVTLGGTNESNFDAPFAGFIDNVRIYDRLLNAAEVFSLYQNDPICTLAAPIASYTLPSSQICLGTPLSFTDQSINSPTAWTYSLFGPATYTSSSQNPVVNITVPGNYLVTMTASNSAGGSGTYTNAVQVYPIPSLTISGFSGSICAGQIGQISASGASSYSWNGVQGTSTYSFLAGSTSSIFITGASLQGCKDSVLYQVSTFPTPSVSILNNTVICSGSTLTLTGTGAQTYTWSTGLQAPSFTMIANNTVIGLKGLDLNGCLGVDSITVSALPLPVVTLSTNITKICKGNKIIFTAGGASSYLWSGAQTGSSLSLIASTNQTITVVGTDTNGCTASASKTIGVSPCVGIEEFEKSNITIYPQPVQDVLNISALEGNARLSIYNASGQLLLQQIATESQVQIDFSNYAEGFYQLIIQSSEKTISRKIVKTP